jgi:uncharacterized BrkB/YihY/UPF0761 family membrane protein
MVHRSNPSMQWDRNDARASSFPQQRVQIMIWTLILLLLVVLLVATIPVYPYSRGWGYYPTSVLALILIVYLLLIWFGLVALWYPWPAAEVEPTPTGAPADETPAAD